MPIIYYDDSCVYCYNYAIWLIRQGLPRNYQFIPLNSKAGRLLEKTHPETVHYNSVILQEGDHLTYESTAIIRMLYTLDHYKWLSALLWIVPKPIRNLGYRTFAENRNKLWRAEWIKATQYEQSFFIE
ncbi:DUF393 domain-containing protein [Staphylococcus sp. 17KM0847]|uniref:thiol-disulfide oxidoreductase DCC family protein n=1 Tax=Staphylococcus sp. 17KM0847 TaxID=2583989 RepID=UPI0015DCE0ED|nr:DCC1-like thiol-disulfide oxidoreductase family protein [Staphylococcus sp. 17KM0847]QLK86542.1 DUF393 domain-containing protein [Staphylococcus sp. 17KM0847]